MKAERSWRWGQSVVVEYVASVLFVVAAAMATVALRKIFPATPSALFFCAVILSAWFGGWGPGMFAAILSGVVAICMPNPLSPQEGMGGEVLRLALFLFTGIFISWICNEQKRAQAALWQARGELERRVAERTGELTAANEGLKTEITERKRAEALLDGQKQVLEMITTNAPLEESMMALVRLIEAQVPGMLGSILLLNEKGCLLHCAAPSLPPQYVAAINGLAIGPEIGSCGTAAYRKEAVVVEDIATDPRWKNYRETALPHGLHACWSTPIFDTQRRSVVGTFAMYYRQPALPKQEHLRLIELATHIASIAICRHHIQAALRESEAKLKEAQRIGKIGHWERDLLADRVTWSEEACRIWGIPGTEYTITQARLQELIHPGDRQLQKQALDDAIHGRRSYDVEYRIVRPDGEIRFLHVQDEIACDETGKPVRLFGTVQDITERKQAEELLRRQEQEIRAIVENSPDLIARFNPELVRTYVNPAFVKAHGVAKERLLGKKAGSTAEEGAVDVTPDEVKILKRWLESVFETSRPVNFETIWPMPAGRRHYAVHLEPEFDSHGALVSVLSLSRDITEHKQAEEEMRKSQQLLNQVLATLPVGVVVTDQLGNIVLVNTASKRMWGDIIVAGRERWARSRGFWHDSGKPVAPEDWASVRALAKGETSLNELIDVETYDGQQKIILNSAAPILNGEGKIVGALVVNEDVTEQKKNEEKLRQTEADLAHAARLTIVGELTASIAHEVNQPLAAVVTNANAVSRWLAAAPPNLEEAREAVKRIVRDGNHASEVIRRMRSLAKKGEPSRTPIDFNKLVQETITVTQPELARKRVSLQTGLEPGLPQVPADPVQLQQVLLNLIVNAADSLTTVTDRPRNVCIRTNRPDPDTVQVAVQDSGVGIEPRQIDRLFQPFYTTKPHGLGMGLAISRSIVEAHGGRLWAIPNNDHGTTFQFTLPVQDGGAS